MKLNLSIISISLVAMATARHNEVIMRPLDAPNHICGSGGCTTHILHVRRGSARHHEHGPL